MYKVIRGAVMHKDTIYRKGAELPASFTNKQGYKHVEKIDDAIEGEFTEVKKPKSKQAAK